MWQINLLNLDLEFVWLWPPGNTQAQTGRAELKSLTPAMSHWGWICRQARSVRLIATGWACRPITADLGEGGLKQNDSKQSITEIGFAETTNMATTQKTQSCIRPSNWISGLKCLFHSNSTKYQCDFRRTHGCLHGHTYLIQHWSFVLPKDLKWEVVV